ncbi:MAG: hypothetical protein IKY11_00270 [Rikenellaceae bacterium]|nr:hypothetical protein [Rikenellaceae bacterium]
MKVKTMLLTTLLLCGATSIASSQTNEGAANPDKTKTEQSQTDVDKDRALEFANLAAVDDQGNPVKLKYMQEHIVITRGDSTRVKWVFDPNHYLNFVVQGVGQSTPEDIRKGVFMVTVKPEKTKEYKYSYTDRSGRETGFYFSFVVIVAEPEEYEAVKARVNNMSKYQLDVYKEKLTNKIKDPMEALMADKMLEMTKEESEEFINKMRKMSDAEVEAYFLSLMKEQEKNNKK